MNKILLYILLLCCPVVLQAQADSTAVSQPAPAVTTTVKDTVAVTYVNRSFQKNFRDNYKDDDFNYTPAPPTDSLWEKFIRGVIWLLDLLFGGSGKAAPFIGIIIRIIVFAIIGLVIYFIIRAIINKDSMWIFGRSRKDIQPATEEALNIHEMDFATLIDKTQRDGNYRLAVRYYYLWVLKRLSTREIIDWHWDKTNSDYLYEIKDSALRTDFEYLSYVYDHSWYAGFPVDEKAFAKAERAFKKTLNTI